MSEAAQHEPLSVAVVGGGLTGLVMTIGLLKRGVRVHLYERTARFEAVGDGIGITPNAEKAMRIVDPRIYEAFKKLASPNEWEWSEYVDGEHPSGGLREFFKIYLGKVSFERCFHDELLIELAPLIPPGAIVFRKDLVSLSDGPGAEPVTLQFRDGTREFADVVIGCDGMRSRVRRYLLDPKNPTSVPHYSHKYLVRGLVDLEEASKALGEEVTSTRLTHLGANAHLLTFPLAVGPKGFLNVVGFVSDPGEWPHRRHTAWAAKQDVVDAFAHFGPTARTIVGLLPQALEKWALFDNMDYAAEAYAGGRVALAGDAAHAVTPHHSASPGLALEDAAALCTLLAEADRTLRDPGLHGRHEVLWHALSTYNEVRQERCEWVVRSSRFIGDMYEWQTPAGRDVEKCCKEANERGRRIWDYNVDRMVTACRKQYDARVNFWTRYMTLS